MYIQAQVIQDSSISNAASQLLEWQSLSLYNLTKTVNFDQN